MVSVEPTVHSIVFNLIDNAIKYTPAAGVINISVYEDGEYACAQIEDSGPGIDPEHYDKVLKRFIVCIITLKWGVGWGYQLSIRPPVG